jgi:hypothetical protein
LPIHVVEEAGELGDPLELGEDPEAPGDDADEPPSLLPLGTADPTVSPFDGRDDCSPCDGLSRS